MSSDISSGISSGMKFNIKTLTLDLWIDWKIARGSTRRKDNFILELVYRGKTFYSEIAPNIRYGESKYKIELQFYYLKSLLNFEEIEDTRQFLFGIFQSEPSLCKCLGYGLDQLLVKAALEFNPSLKKKLFPQLISYKTNSQKISTVKTSFSIPIMHEDEILKFYEDHQLDRFECLKIKVAGLEDVSLVSKIQTKYKGMLRIDGNEGFNNANEVLEFQDSIDLSRVELFEQMLPASNIDELLNLAAKIKVPHFADESITDQVGFSKDPNFINCFSGVNLKLMKSGSCQRFYQQACEAKAHGFTLLQGCMIESTLGILDASFFSSLFDLYDLDGFLFLESDPFNHLYEKDGSLFFPTL